MKLPAYRHQSGLNCETACQRNVLAGLGLELDEDMLFGLDGNFGFGFFAQNGNGADIVIGRQEIFPGRAARLLGVKMTEFRGGGAKRLTEHLDRGQAVILRVDLGELPWWAERGAEAFGGYFVVAAGHDAETGGFTVSDPGFDAPQQLAADSLQRARQSKSSPPINPEQRGYVVEQVGGVPDLGRIGPAAASQTVRAMLKPGMNSFGLPGLKRLAAAVPAWPRAKTGMVEAQLAGGEIVPLSALARQLLSFGRTVELFGTGGGLFRPMWSRYLRRLGEMGGNEALLAAAESVEASGREWSKLGRELLEIGPDSGPAVLNGHVAGLVQGLDAVIRHETRALDNLKHLGRSAGASPALAVGGRV